MHLRSPLFKIIQLKHLDLFWLSEGDIRLAFSNYIFVLTSFLED